MTTKEIAKLANVSLGTVDRVIHNRGKVAPNTKKRVLEILERVNYRPNIYARGLVLNKSFTIAALVPAFEPGEYWEIPQQGIRKGTEDLQQFGMQVKIFEFDQNSPESFIDQASKVLELRPDGVILAPVINFEAVKFTLKLKDLKIPFTLIDSNIANSGALSFIGQDAYQSGKLAAKLLKLEIMGSGAISIISLKNNENHNKTLQKRIEGFKDYFLGSDVLNKISLREFDIHQRNKDWKEILVEACKLQGTDGIFVPSSKVHYVAEVLKDLKLDIRLVGYDLIEKNRMYLKKGIINSLICQQPEKQGYIALDDFYKALVLKQMIQKERYLPLDIVAQENLDYYDDTLMNYN
ncbi:LacI family DNA-binding transcriptional regulator [Flavimarina sp. Hel_I_48]|uniref:LacI family DNA-binding transcriptional regulator n=1 Tax=Flavimarina sp. Hel_I_48 TaxID=1392488 RepID=UPI0004DED326|nr:LacI family DNA-binding transcriptional regulator [Flavimarina sp. Hel_I_48]